LWCLLCLAAGAAFAQSGAASLPRLAVVSFSVNDEGNAKLVRDAVTVRNLVESQMIATRKYTMITREEIDKLLREQRIQLSSITSSENIRKLRLANISYLVTGSVDAMDTNYAVTVRILDVATGQFYHSDNAFMSGEAQPLYNGINSLANRFAAGLSGSGGQITQRPAAATAGVVYQVGDIGPAGGRVFYDKGSFSNGWRYLEAAPAETEFTAQWGAFERNVGGTGTAAGMGKRNTQLIVEYLRSSGESGRAAQLCDSFSMDGYDDWFLPSIDELDLMNRNLYQRGLGEFTRTLYWSSSQDDYKMVWIQNFGNIQAKVEKGFNFWVRPVRAF
jgi:hypothetical protein